MIATTVIGRGYVSCVVVHFSKQHREPTACRARQPARHNVRISERGDQQMGKLHLSFFAHSAYHPKPKDHGLSERLIINVSTSGFSATLISNAAERFCLPLVSES